MPVPASIVAAASEREHTRLQALLFSAKAWVFRARRFWEDQRYPRLRRFPANPGAWRTGDAPTCGSEDGTGDLAREVEASREFSSSATSIAANEPYESRSLLFSSEAPAEFALQAGKVHNLRAAAARLNGIVVPAGETFSFWKHVPRPTRARGFVAGRELREGCVIPSIGGGLCQLSNALYAAALEAQCEIVERHAHSRILPDAMAATGRDATVFWNYVDLRFWPRTTLKIEVALTRRELIVRFHPVESKLPGGEQLDLGGDAEAVTSGFKDELNDEALGSCETCGVTSCFRHLEPGARAGRGITAFVVDAWWPEFDSYVQDSRHPGDWLFTPLDSVRFRLGPYRWSGSNFAKVVQAPLPVLARSLASRRLAAQGAERQRALLRFDEMLARHFAARLPFAATHLVVSQNLLPFLWREGALGGRTFDVLMTRLPLVELEAALDRAQAKHPESRTLSDYRADPGLLAAESAALAEADQWITPHSTIARLAGARSCKLEWTLPGNGSGRGSRDSRGGARVVFAASTLARKGAFDLREVARQLDLAIGLSGPVIESTDFWHDVNAVSLGKDWLRDAACVVLPAWIEHQPRRALQAASAGLPVIVSDACGLAGVDGVTTVASGDVHALRSAIEAVLQLEAS